MPKKTRYMEPKVPSPQPKPKMPRRMIAKNKNAPKRGAMKPC